MSVEVGVVFDDPAEGIIFDELGEGYEVGVPAAVCLFVRLLYMAVRGMI